MLELSYIFSKCQKRNKFLVVERKSLLNIEILMVMMMKKQDIYGEVDQ